MSTASGREDSRRWGGKRPRSKRSKGERKKRGDHPSVEKIERPKFCTLLAGKGSPRVLPTMFMGRKEGGVAIN